MRIVALLREAEAPWSARELAGELNLAVSSVKEQCAGLVQRGLVARHRRRSRRGRPETTYALAPGAANTSEEVGADCAGEILEAAARLLGEAMPEKLLLVMLQRREARWAQALGDGTGLARWQALARWRRGAGYLCEAASVDGVLLLQDRNRPLDRLLRDHPGLVRFEEQAVARLLGPATICESSGAGRLWRAPAVESKPLWETQRAEGRTA